MNNTNEPISVFIYSRKSRFTGAGESIENQIELCRNHARHIFPEGCNFHIYEDEGYSAKNVDRPQWQQLMSDLEIKKCHTLICYRLDRISRSVSDFSTIMDYLVDHEINFISVRENFDTSTPMGRAMIYIASVFAQLERETITERVRDNKFRLYRTGRWQGGKAPLGYQAVKSTYHDDEGAKRSMFVLEPIPEEQEHLRFLFAKFVELGSLTALDSYLLQNHIHSCRGNDYSQATLRQLLTNPIYAPNAPIVYDYLATLGCDIVEPRESFDGKSGLVAYARTTTKGTKNTTRVRNTPENWIIATGYHQGLVSPEQWVHVQQTIQANGQRHPRQGTSNVALLSGLIRCKQCGAPMAIKGNRNNVNNEKLYYYVCTRKSRSHGELCNVANIQGRSFDQHIVDLLKEAFATGGEVAESLENNFHAVRSEKIDYQKRIRYLERQIEENNEASVTLATKMAYTKSDAEDDAIRSAIQNLSDEKNTLVQSLNQIRQCSIVSVSGLINIEMMKAAVQSFISEFDELPLEEQRDNLKNIVRSITWDGKSATIDLFHGVDVGKKKLH